MLRVKNIKIFTLLMIMLYGYISEMHAANDGLKQGLHNIPHISIAEIEGSSLPAQLRQNQDAIETHFQQLNNLNTKLDYKGLTSGLINKDDSFTISKTSINGESIYDAYKAHYRADFDAIKKFADALDNASNENIDVLRRIDSEIQKKINEGSNLCNEVKKKNREQIKKNRENPKVLPWVAPETSPEEVKKISSGYSILLQEEINRAEAYGAHLGKVRSYYYKAQKEKLEGIEIEWEGVKTQFAHDHILKGSITNGELAIQMVSNKTNLLRSKGLNTVIFGLVAFFFYKFSAFISHDIVQRLKAPLHYGEVTANKVEDALTLFLTCILWGGTGYYFY